MDIFEYVIDKCPYDTSPVVMEDVNEIETNLYTFEELIYECPDDTSPAIMNNDVNE